MEDAGAATLDRLVERTTGPQPWRKVFHACNALVVVAALELFQPSRAAAVAVAAVFTLAAFAVDLARMVSPRANELFFLAFSRLASPRERGGIASSTWYATSILIVLAFFERDVAVTSILVMGVGDPAAGYIGRRWGKRPLLGGSVLGCSVFLTVAAALVGFRHGWIAALPVGLVATFLERRSWPLDDNLTVPVVTAVTLTAILAWL